MIFLQSIRLNMEYACYDNETHVDTNFYWGTELYITGLYSTGTVTFNYRMHMYNMYTL